MASETKEQLASKVLQDLPHRPVVVSYVTDDTKYDLVFTRITSMLFVGIAKEHALPGAHPPGDFVMVNAVNFGTCHAFKLLNNHDKKLHYAYVMEKLKMREPDAKNVTKFLQCIIDMSPRDD